MPRGPLRLAQAAIPRLSASIHHRAVRRFCSPASSHALPLYQPFIAKRAALSSIYRSPAQIRWHSTPQTKSKVYEFNDIKSLSENKQSDRILIDVREPSEYQEGYIPTAINLPIKSAPEALLLPSEDFEDRFGMPKPAVDQEVIFYCRSGVRSSAAAQLAEQAGYQNIGEYRGSWLDWAEKGGPVGR